MSVNQVTGATNNYGSSTSKVNSNQTNTSGKTSNNQSSAAVYEKSSTSESTKKIYQRDDATIEKLKQETERRTQSLRELVEKLLIKQGKTYDASTDIYSLLREGKVDVDSETKAQAQKDISEDGYWGIKQTSERLVSFAKALTGGDPSKANEMIAAVKKGFDQATKAWGDELPDICKKTMDAAISKLEAWRDSAEDSSSMEETAESSFKDQAASKAMAE